MCDLLEYSVGQHKSTLWTLICLLFTMLAVGIAEFIRNLGKTVESLSFGQILELIWNDFFWFLVTLAITIVFLILLNCRADGCCCLDCCLCVFVAVILEMLFHPGLFLLFLWQLVMNIRGMVNVAQDNILQYDFFRMLILAIFQFLLVIYMPLLIVRMAWYLIRCLPCCGTRRLGDMCKNQVYYGNDAPPPRQAQPQVYFVQQGGGGMSRVVIGQPK